MDYETNFDSQIVYDKFIDNYKNPKKYNSDVKLYFANHRDEKRSIMTISFFKLISVYIVICLLIFLAKLVFPDSTFGGFTYTKLFKIYGVFLLVFCFLYILAIANIPDKRSIIIANLSIYDALEDLGIIESKKRIEIIDHLIEDKAEVGSFYIKLINIVKKNKIVKYLLWLSSIFIGIYTGLINSVITKNMDGVGEIVNKPFRYLLLLGKQLGSIFCVVLLFSIIYYVTIDFLYKQGIREYNFYFLALNNVKFKLLLEDKGNTDTITNEEDINMKDKKKDKHTDDTKVSTNTSNLYEKYKIYKKYIIQIVVILYSILSVIYIFAYSNFIETMTNKSKLFVIYILISYFLYVVLKIESKRQLLVSKNVEEECSNLRKEHNKVELSQIISRKQIIIPSLILLGIILVTRWLVNSNSINININCIDQIVNSFGLNLKGLIAIIVLIVIFMSNIRLTINYYLKENDLFYMRVNKDKELKKTEMKNESMDNSKTEESCE